MALPSAVTLGSLAIVVAAGAGLGVVAKHAADRGFDRQATQASVTKPTATTHPKNQRQRRRSPDPVPNTLVDVFNNSGRTGLAARTARYLEGAGWNVAGADNWYGDIPADTVYFPPRRRSDAVVLARALQIHRLHRAVAPMQFDRLTVILTGG